MTELEETQEFIISNKQTTIENQQSEIDKLKAELAEQRKALMNQIQLRDKENAALKELVRDAYPFVEGFHCSFVIQATKQEQWIERANDAAKE